jgi:hypothetical protein
MQGCRRFRWMPQIEDVLGTVMFPSAFPARCITCTLARRR